MPGRECDDRSLDILRRREEHEGLAMWEQSEPHEGKGWWIEHWWCVRVGPEARSDPQASQTDAVKEPEALGGALDGAENCNEERGRQSTDCDSTDERSEEGAGAGCAADQVTNAAFPDSITHSFFIVTGDA